LEMTAWTNQIINIATIDDLFANVRLEKDIFNKIFEMNIDN